MKKIVSAVSALFSTFATLISTPVAAAPLDPSGYALYSTNGNISLSNMSSFTLTGKTRSETGTCTLSNMSSFSMKDLVCYGAISISNISSGTVTGVVQSRTSLNVANAVRVSGGSTVVNSIGSLSLAQVTAPTSTSDPNWLQPITIINGNYSISNASHTNVNGTIYATGTITIGNSSSINGTATLVAGQGVVLSNVSTLGSSSAKFFVYAMGTQGITISNMSSATIRGSLYAPNGPVNLNNMSSATVTGGIFGKTISLSNMSQFNIGPGSAVQAATPPGIISQVTTPPAAPSNLTAAAASFTSASLTWIDNSNNESSFLIERASGISYTQIATVPANTTSYTDTGLASNSSYSYRVRATNAGGNSAYTNIASATLLSPPNAPSSLVATPTSSTAIALAWTDNSSNETSFRVERSTDNLTFSEIGNVAANVVAYNDTGLTNGRTYYYRVRARNGAGDSAYSDPANATLVPPLPSPPAAPSNLVATASSSTAIGLTWVDNSNNETSFRIERSTDGISFSEITSTAADVTSYSDTGLASDATYYYRVRARNAGGDSAYSNSANATIVSLPTAPSNLVATANGSTRIDLTWADNSSNEVTFRIERSSNNITFNEIGNVGANVTAYSDTGLTSNATYYYRVRARNTAGDSGYSNSANATLVAVPSDPSNLVASANGYTTINLTWVDNSVNETSFRIERSSDNVSFSEIGSVDADVTSFSNTSLSAGTYYYRVRARNAVGDSAYSNVANATLETPPSAPSAPSNLVATANGSTEIDLEWVDNSNNEVTFRIERSTDNASFSEIASVAANVTTYRDQSLASGTYFYRVRARNAVGDSAYSNSANASLQDPCDPRLADSGYNSSGSYVEVVALCGLLIR